MNARASKAFRDIFPNGDINLFMRFFSFWRDVDNALWAYGEIRKHEYKRERAILKQELQG